MTTEGFVKLPRSMLEWGWLDDANTLKVYIVLLLSANWKDAEWHGITVRRGQLITSVKSICEKSKLSTHQVRTALEHLTMTNDITIETTSKFSIITLNNYDTETQTTNETANKRQTNDKEPSITRQTNGNETATIEERKEEKEIKENKEREETLSPPVIPKNSQITRDDLIQKYGIDNVLLYESKLTDWKSRKGITDGINDLNVIAKWLSEDNVQKPRKSSFEPDEIMAKIIGRYRS